MLAATLAAVAIAWVFAVGLSKPRWVGEGDWEACIPIAQIPPADAAEAVARREGVNLWDFRAHVGPAFVNSSGWESTVTCSGGLSIGPGRNRLPTPTPDREDHYAWRVDLSEEWGLLSLGPTFIDWSTGACVWRSEGC